MDWKSIVIFVIIVVGLVWLLVRLRGNVRNPPRLRMAMEMISNLNDNLRIIVQKQSDPSFSKKFKIESWKNYQEHLAFLEPEYKEYIEPLRNSFTQMEEYNKTLTPSGSSLGAAPAPIDLDNLKEVTVQARTGLAKWIQDNIQRESTRGFFSFRS
jgi:hypothetical protein